MCNVVHMSSPANRVNLGWKQSVPQGGFQDLHTMLQIKTFTLCLDKSKQVKKVYLVNSTENIGLVALRPDT